MKKWAVNMKDKWNKYWSKIWFKLLIITIGVLVVVGLLYCAGLRITYAPELENNWDSISAYAAWFSVVVSIVGVGASFAAVWYAIQIPKQIADEQNKIALFEKRFTCFQLIERFIKLCECIKNVSDIKTSRDTMFLVMIDVIKMERLNSIAIAERLFEYKNIAYQMQFLFSEIDRDDIAQLYSSFQQFFYAIVNEDNVSETYSTYLDCLNSFLDKYHGLICNNLTVSNI